MQTPIIAQLHNVTRARGFDPSDKPSSICRFRCRIDDELCAVRLYAYNLVLPSKYYGHWFELSGFSLHPVYVTTTYGHYVLDANGNPVQHRVQANIEALYGLRQFTAIPDAPGECGALIWLGETYPAETLPHA